MAQMVQKLYAAGGAGTGTNNALASVDVPADGELTGITWAITGSDAGVATGFVELAFGGVAGVTTNDTRGCVSTAGYSNNAAGFGFGVTQHVPFDPPIKVMGGDRLYLNNVNSAAFDALLIACSLHLNTAAAAGRTRRL